jgi:signal transduction histidine kinase
VPVKPKLLFIFLFYFIAASLKAQIVPYEKYTSKDGLISDRITAIGQDQQGFMWFGSYFGICRYDGIRFEKIDLPEGQKNKYVNFILPAHGNMYAGFLFNGGLAEYARGKLQSYFISGRDSASANEFSCMAEDTEGGIILCNTSNQVYRFNKGAFSFIADLPQKGRFIARIITRDRDKYTWLATEHGLFICDPKFRVIKLLYPEENIFSLVKDQSGHIWFSRFDGNNTYTEMADGCKDGKLIGEKIMSVSNTRKQVLCNTVAGNNYWELDQVKGLARIDSTGLKSFFRVPVDISTDINVIFSDREHNIWIANEPGIIKVSNLDIRNYLFSEIAAAGGSIFRENDSALWLSNSKALYHIVNDRIDKMEFDRKVNDYLGVLHKDRDNNLWIGLWNGGIWKTRWNNEKLVSQSFIENYKGITIKAQAIIEDGKGNMWIGGLNGLFHFKDGEVKDHFHPLNKMGGPCFISCLTIDEKNHTIWMGDNSTGMIQLNYSLQPGGTCKYELAKYVSNNEGLKDNYVRSVFIDVHHNLWIGTRSGGIFLLGEHNGLLTIKDCNKAAQLSCNRVVDIEPEDSLATWFASCDGIYRYQYAGNRWTHYSTTEGLINAEVFNISIDRKNGYVWALTSQGVARMPVQPGSYSALPLVSLVSVSVLGKKDSAALFAKEPARYTYLQNSLGFSFAGASFIDEKKVRYKYILEGYEHQWSEPVLTNSVNYASLPPGKYVFKVMAANARGEWSREPASFAFEIILPFYKRTWFIFLMITLALFIVYLIRFQRLRHRYQIEKIRLGIARDLHDDVGSTLGSINLLSKTASRKLGKEETVEGIQPIFQKIGQSAETTLEAMDDIVWSINPEKDKLQDLVIRMREFAIPLFEANEIEFDFRIQGDTGQSIPMNRRRNCFLIYKEAVHNLLKHAGASKVTILLKFTHRQVIMEVRDNGKGFNQDSLTRRNGLKNMRSRAESIGGLLEIESSGSGTTIYFYAPIV